MVTLASLWLPILVSAVLVFIASSISHAVLPWHHSDYGQLPDEDAVMDAMRRTSVAPGDYHFPRPSTRAALKDPAFQERYKKGPVALMTVWPAGGPPMGRIFALWFVYCLAVASFTALLASFVLKRGEEWHHVMHFTWMVSLGAHVFALWPASIWYGKAWSTTLKSTVDGIVYGLVTGFAFAWLWPR